MWLLWADEVTSTDNKGVWATAAGRSLRRSWIRDVATLQRDPGETDDEYEARRALLLLEWTPGYDQRTYECPRCQHEVTEVIQFRERRLAATRGKVLFRLPA